MANGIRHHFPDKRVTCKSGTARLTLPLFRLAGFLTQPFAYRGIGTLSRKLERLLPAAPVEVKLSPQTSIHVDLFDYYWSRIIFDDFTYEGEIEFFLNRQPSKDYIFIDCGANIGYWSLLMSERLPPGRIIAIEASPRTFAKLEKNRLLAGSRFRTMNKALSDQAGKTVSFFISTGHAAARIAKAGSPDDQNATNVFVETTTIDEVLSDCFPDDSGLPVLIKLDVEGAEIDVLKGAEQTIRKRDVTIIYECHGSDRDCTTTRHLLDDGRFDLFSIEGAQKSITCVEDALALKLDTRKGYNFVAVRKSFSQPCIG